MIAFAQIGVYPKMKLSPASVIRRASLGTPVTAAFSMGYKILAGVDEVVSFILKLISTTNQSLYNTKKQILLTHILL